MGQGDVYALNNPYNGGTHLPDVTVVMPVFHEGGGSCSSPPARAHHADIGGITPGSMPPDSTHIDQEGVLFDNFHLVEHGRLRERELDELLASGPTRRATRPRTWPTSRPRSRPASAGRTSCAAMVAQFGLDTVRAYMGHVQDNAEESVRRVLDVLKDGEFVYAARPGPRDPRADLDRPRRPPRPGRLHRHRPAAALELQRARGRDPRRGALRLPHAGRRRHPDERGLPEADRHRAARGLDRQPAATRPRSAPATSRPRSG